MPLTESVNQESVAIASRKNEVSTDPVPAKHLPEKEENKVCWIEVKRYPYQPGHQVELLHLQAEADALLIKLQNRSH